MYIFVFILSLLYGLVNDFTLFSADFSHQTQKNRDFQPLFLPILFIK